MAARCFSSSAISRVTFSRDSPMGLTMPSTACWRCASWPEAWERIFSSSGRASCRKLSLFSRNASAAVALKKSRSRSPSPSWPFSSAARPDTCSRSRASRPRPSAVASAQPSSTPATAAMTAVTVTLADEVGQADLVLEALDEDGAGDRAGLGDLLRAEAVEDVDAVLARAHHARLPQDGQVLGGVRLRDLQPLGELVDADLADVLQDVQDLEAFRIGESLAEFGLHLVELLVHIRPLVFVAGAVQSGKFVCRQFNDLDNRCQSQTTA